MGRRRHDGIRKLCRCRRSRWSECRHSWHFNFQWRGKHHRFSIDRHLGRNIRGWTEAVAEAEKIRAAIRDGTFATVRADDPSEPPATLDTFADTYLARALDGRSDDTYMLKVLKAFVPPDTGVRLVKKALPDVTEDDLEIFMDHLRAKGRSASTRNKYVQTIKAMFRWAVRKGHLARNPISKDSGLRREKHNQRSRRLQGDEEKRLLAAAPPRLQRLVVAAMETGMRQGELLSLRWKHVDRERREITVLPAKTAYGRTVPISDRLDAVLEMARLDPAGQPYGPEAHVFGNVGRRVTTIQKVWQTLVLEAYGHTPSWSRETKRLMPDSQALYRKVDLHFHDLRHEAGSRWLEQGMPLHHVKELLGHRSIDTTNTYLNAGAEQLKQSMRAIDARRKAERTEPTSEDEDGFVQPADGVALVN